jgi:hypothetical protein
MAVRCFLLSITILLFRRLSGGEGRGGGVLLRDPAAEMGQLGVGLGQGTLDAQTLCVSETRGQLAPLSEAAARQRSDALEVAQQGLSRTRLDRLEPLFLEGAQVEPRLFEQPLTRLGRAGAPGVVELSDLPGGESVLGDSTGETLAVLAAFARQRHQGPERRLHRNPALAQVLLDRLRQRFDHRQTTRDPARAAVEASGKLFQA